MEKKDIAQCWRKEGEYKVTEAKINASYPMHRRTDEMASNFENFTYVGRRGDEQKFFENNTTSSPLQEAASGSTQAIRRLRKWGECVLPNE